MSSLHPGQSAQIAADVTQHAADRPDSYWRSLHFFNIYRLAVGLLLLGVVAVFGDSLTFGSHNLALFVYADAAYVLFSAACFGLIGSRRRFSLQLSVQVAADVMFIVVMMHASGGISSGLGLLLLPGLAAAGLVSRGRLTLFHAALASIAVLLEHAYAVLRLDAAGGQYLQAGLLSIAYFTTAWLAHALAKYAVASEQLAAQREIDLANMAEVNQLVIRDMPDGVLVVDESGVIRQFNSQAESMLGAVPRGRRDTLLAEYAPALAARLTEWREKRSTGFGAADVVLVNRTVTARFVPVGKSRNVGVVIFLEDVGRVEAQARQMKLAALGRLTANIAHEIRNPLGAISHAAELLQEEPAINETTTRLLAIIHDNSRRLDRMVNDVLKLNRGYRAHHEVFRLGEYLRTFVEEFCQIEKVARPVFAIEMRGDPSVSFDSSHLNQVMWNLCRNALRHCRSEAASIRIVVGNSAWGNAVKLDVIDDGPGVPPALRNQLFEPFFTTAPGGTGLGLYIAREVCEANGARLDYVETPSGAQFTILCRGA